MRFGIDKALCTFEKSKLILEDYNNDVMESVVDNMVPYDIPTIYEEQVLHDLTNNTDDTYDPVTHIDPYGYRRDQYHDVMEVQDNNTRLSRSDISFFYSVNK